jgi:glutathione S-transferase
VVAVAALPVTVGGKGAGVPLVRVRDGVGSYLEAAKLGIPTGVAARASAPIAAAARRFNRATGEAVAQDLETLPALIDHVDELIEQGVIGSPDRNAADFQIATSVRLLLTMDDVRSSIEGRPAERLAREVVPDQPGHMPSVFAS